MKKALLLISSLTLLAVAGCNKETNVISEPSEPGELAVIPVNGDGAPRMTKGYVEETKFAETYYSTLHGTKTEAPRTMQLSAYLTPQEGECKNYFVDKTYSKDPSSETTWWNTNTVGGAHDPIYWPVGGTLDFLAYSVSSETTGAGKSQNIKTVWDNTNAAQKVTLTVPGENTQNDILFASAYGVESKNGATPVAMTFNHAQAWLEFILTGSTDDVHKDGIVNVQKIELENVYNAGTLNITNNGGNATAKWDFTGMDKQNIAVDNFNENLKLNATAKYLDMLIPQQTKTAFVIYYTLGSDTQVLSYRFTTDQKTWLMGEKYIYTINIATSEVTVAPSVIKWSNPADGGFSYAVKTPAKKIMYGDTQIGTVQVGFSPSDSFKMEGTPADDGSATYTCDTWGAQVTLTATPNGGASFVKWSDGVTENPRTFTITESVNLPEAVFGYKITTTGDASRCTTVTETYIAGESATIEGSPAEGYKLYKWYSDAGLATELTSVDNITVSADGKTITIASVNAEMTFYAKYIPQDAIAAPFSVSADKKVFFSKGNLYATVTFGTGDESKVAKKITGYAFESDQTYYRTWNNDVDADKYATSGKEDKAFFGYGMTTTPAGTVGTFYWTKSALVATSKVYNDSPDISDAFFAAGLKVRGHTWSCLTKDEFNYLLNTGGVGRSDENRFALAKVNGICGLLIFPDGYTGTINVTGIGEINKTLDQEYPSDSIEASTWTSMQEAGVVFLPASGYRSGSAIVTVGSTDSLCGLYWSNTLYDNEFASALYFFGSDAYKLGVGIGNNYHSTGCSVRLVSE